MDCFLQGWSISRMCGQPSRMPRAGAVTGWEAGTKQLLRIPRLLGFSCWKKRGSILAGQLMPSTPSFLKRSQEKLQKENDISRVTHKEGNKNVLWKAMGQRYMLRGLGDKAGRMKALQDRYASSPVHSCYLSGHDTETSDLSKYKDHSCLFTLLKNSVLGASWGLNQSFQTEKNQGVGS